MVEDEVSEEYVKRLSNDAVKLDLFSVFESLLSLVEPTEKRLLFKDRGKMILPTLYCNTRQYFTYNLMDYSKGIKDTSTSVTSNLSKNTPSYTFDKLGLLNRPQIDTLRYASIYETSNNGQ